MPWKRFDAPSTSRRNIAPPSSTPGRHHAGQGTEDIMSQQVDPDMLAFIALIGVLILFV